MSALLTAPPASDGDTLEALHEIEQALNSIKQKLSGEDSLSAANLQLAQQNLVSVHTVESKCLELGADAATLNSDLDTYFALLQTLAATLTTTRGHIDDLSTRYADVEFAVSTTYLRTRFKQIIQGLDLGSASPQNITVRAIHDPWVVTQEAVFGRYPCDIFCKDQLGVHCQVDLTFLGQQMSVWIFFAIGISLASGSPKPFVAHRAQIRNADPVLLGVIEDIETKINAKLENAISANFSIPVPAAIPNGPAIKLLTNKTGAYFTKLEGSINPPGSQPPLSMQDDPLGSFHSSLRLRLQTLIDFVNGQIVSQSFGFATPAGPPEVHVDVVLGLGGGSLVFWFNLDIPFFGTYRVPATVYFIAGPHVQLFAQYYVPTHFHWQWHGFDSGFTFDWELRTFSKDFHFGPETTFMLGSIYGDSLYILSNYA